MNLACADLHRLLGDSAGHRLEVAKFEMTRSLVPFGITVSNSPIRGLSTPHPAGNPALTMCTGVHYSLFKSMVSVIASALD